MRRRLSTSAVYVKCYSFLWLAKHQWVAELYPLSIGRIMVRHILMLRGADGVEIHKDGRMERGISMGVTGAIDRGLARFH